MKELGCREWGDKSGNKERKKHEEDKRRCGGCDLLKRTQTHKMESSRREEVRAANRADEHKERREKGRKKDREREWEMNG